MISRIRTSSLLTGAALLGAATASGAAFAQDNDLNALLETMRAEFSKYQDVNVALADGYIPDPSGMCVTAEEIGLPGEAGAMGIHYLNPALLQLTDGGDRVAGNATNTDPMQPVVLLYEPRADGTVELLGVELLVFEDAWRAAGNTDAPTLLDQAWNYMINDPATAADEAHGFVGHYDLHVWLYRDNPNGVLTPFNPAVTCEHAAP
jgi:hypothetical protein